MSLVLNTNYGSLLAQDSLTTSGNELNTALQQLSTGLRINSAADDAAGYAIVQGMTSQINGLGQASQNANDGVSLTQTAQGSLTEITNDLQTMRDLAVESLNATNSSQDRADLDQQFQQLSQDINSVAQSASFNGVNLLDGSFQGATFQIGANVGQTISVSSVASAETSALGAVYTDTADAGTYTAAAVTAGDSGTITITAADGKTYTTDPVTLTGTATTDLATVAAAINQLSSNDGGVIATVNTAGTGINLSSASALATGATIGVAYTPSGTETETAGDLGLGATYSAANFAANTSYLNTASVDSVDSSNLALAQIDSALQQVAASGAQLGAYQNRFQAAITGLSTDSTNLQSARSGIEDTDYASATSQLSQAQILQQASTAMVAQANTIPQNILTLLQKLP